MAFAEWDRLWEALGDGGGDTGVVGVGDPCEKCHKSVNFVKKSTSFLACSEKPFFLAKEGPLSVGHPLAPQMPQRDFKA